MVTRSIADELEIRSLVHRYADAASRRDPAAVASTFTNDGEWHAPELGHHKGRDAMIAFFTSMLDGWNVFLQGLLSGVVVLNAADADQFFLVLLHVAIGMGLAGEKHLGDPSAISEGLPIESQRTLLLA